MSRTQIPSEQIGDGQVKRADLNTATSGSAVVAKLIQGTGISLSSTGADAGTGDVTVTIASGSVTYALMQDISATQRVLGRNTAGAGDPEEVTATQLLDWIGATRGSILYKGASGWGILTPGAAGYVLKSNGSGADPTWEAMQVAITRTASSTSSSGNTSVISAQGAGNKIAVYAYALQAAGTVTAKLTDGSGGTAQTIPWLLQAREGVTMPNGGQPLWVGTANTALFLNLDAAVATGYELSWAVTT